MNNQGNFGAMNNGPKIASNTPGMNMPNPMNPPAGINPPSPMSDTMVMSNMMTPEPSHQPLTTNDIPEGPAGFSNKANPKVKKQSKLVPIILLVVLVIIVAIAIAYILL